MAQTGYTPILIYASGTASAVPSASNMTSSASGAELALNYADGKLYYKNSSGVVTLLASTSGGYAGGSNTQVQYNSSGVLAGSANLTFNGTTLTANTIGAFTLSGTIAGGGNQINNVIIGTSTPLAGSFTTLSATGQITGRTSNGAVFVTSNGSDADFVLSLASGLVTQNVTGSLQLQTGGSNRAVISSTGLAVTGALTNTGQLTNNRATGADTYINHVTTGINNTVMGFNNSGSTNSSGVLNNTAYIGSLNTYSTAVVGNGAVIATFQASSVGSQGIYVNGVVSIASSGVFPSVGFAYNTNGYLYQLGGTNGIIQQIGGSNITTLTATGLGIGNTPSALLDVGPTTSSDQVAAILRAGAGLGNSGGLGLYTNASDANARNWGIVSNSNVYGDFLIRQGTSVGSNPLTGTTRFSISKFGIVSIGAPSNVAANDWSGAFAYQAGNSGNFYGDGQSYNWVAGVSLNSYRNANAWYNTNASLPTGRFEIGNGATGSVGGFAWYWGTGGSAGAAAAQSQFMTLDTSGRLLVGATSAAGSLGSGTIQVGSGHGGITNTGSVAPSIVMSGSLEFNLDGVSGSQRHGRIIGTAGQGLGSAYGGGLVLQYYSYDGVSTYQWYDGLSVLGNGNVVLGNVTGDPPFGTNGSLGVKGAIGFTAGTTGSYYYTIQSNTTDFYIGTATLTRYAALTGLTTFTAWSFGSDRRIKYDIEDVKYGLQTVLDLKPRQYKFKDGDDFSIGFIAQELKEVVPEAVTGEEIEFDDADTPQERAKKTMGVSKDTLIPVLVKAIQELKAEFDAYKASHP